MGNSKAYHYSCVVWVERWKGNLVKIRFIFSVWFVLMIVLPGCRRDTDPLKKDPSALDGMRGTGNTLTVFLDGHQTRETKGTTQPAWTARRISGTPTILFQVASDTFELPLKRVNITINPVVEGKVNEAAIYRPTARLSQPDQKIRLEGFDYIDSKEHRKVAKLPPGRYRFSIRVIGQKNHDRQIIFVTVE